MTKAKSKGQKLAERRSRVTADAISPGDSLA